LDELFHKNSTEIQAIGGAVIYAIGIGALILDGRRVNHPSQISKAR
jgi:hypothetical protein